MESAREELNKLRASDLQKELESRNLDSGGKKSELVERLLMAQQLEQESQVAVGGTAHNPGKQDPMLEARLLLTKLRILREQESLSTEEIDLKAQTEREQVRIRARREQLELEMKLAEMGHDVESDPMIRSLSIKGAPEPERRGDVPQAFAEHIQRSLLPPTELPVFSGNIQEYHLFLRAFEARVSSKTQDRQERLHYLAQFTKGAPHTIVKACMSMGSRGFAEAMKLLDDRYGDSHRLVESYVERLKAWPRLPQGDIAEPLDQFVLFLTEIRNCMADVDLAELEHPRCLREIAAKLPHYLRDRWVRKADNILQVGGAVSFADMVDFLAAELRIKRNPLFGEGKVVTDRREPAAPKHRVNFAKVKGGTSLPAPPQCFHCRGPHAMDTCEKLRWLPLEQRREIVFQGRLCFACLGQGHRAKFCTSRLTCRVCRRKHPTLLHREWTPPRETVMDQSGAVGAGQQPRALQGLCQAPLRPGQDQPKETGPSVLSAGVGVKSQQERVMMPVVPVRLTTKAGREVTTNCFLDMGSSGSFITEGLVQRLGLQGEDVDISLDTVTTQDRTVKSSVVDGIKVGALSGGEMFSLPPLFTLGNLPVAASDSCQPAEVTAWPHLSGINLQTLECPVELMLGSNVAELLVAREVKAPLEGPGPVGVRSHLGWHVIGSGGGRGRQRRYRVNFLRLTEPAPVPRRDCALEMVKQLYQKEFEDVSDDRTGFSLEDREWLDEVESTVRKDSEGHFEIALPRVQTNHIPNSYPAAERRLFSLRNKFKKDPALFQKYKAVIKSLSEDGYAVKVPPEEEMEKGGWYLPHHGVEEPAKGKVRVVFDCACRSGGVCLNDMLRGGPILTNSLVGVLCRFREGEIAFTSDIQAMYHRVRVPEADSVFQKFLWFEADDLDGSIEVWKMRSHIFGAVSSSSVASFALRLCGKEGEQLFPQAADVLLRKSYVDDLLAAAPSVEEAVKLARDLKELCQTGAFSLRKFSSNSSEFLKSIPAEERGKGLKDLDLDKDQLNSGRVLGLEWNMESDEFGFQFKNSNRPRSRRGILSVTSSIFDPLGIAAPVTLGGKVLLQKLCTVSLGWDDEITGDLAEEWERWLSQAKQLSRIRVQRSVVGPPGKIVDTQLHVFADASELAYSSVAYIRRKVITQSGNQVVFTQFLFGKSRVNPVKAVSIPRLELAAAVLAVKVRKILERELDLRFDSIRMWTDSMVVLMYIRNRTSRFKVYVANRLAYIHDGSEVSEWSYVPSEVNSADVGSRGTDPQNLEPWLKGPPFLTESEDHWPEEPAVQQQLPEAEVKRSSPVAAVNLSIPGLEPFDVLIRYYSSFYRLKRAVSWYRRFLSVLRNGEFRRFCLASRKGLRRRGPPAVERRPLRWIDLQHAERAIVQWAQKDLPDLPQSEMGDGLVVVKRGSPLEKLRPHLRNGLLVVGGRLDASASLPEAAKHPVILPRRHHVTQLLMREAHEKVGHGGQQHTFWKLREKYWVIGASPEIRQLLRSCVTCRKANAQPLRQLMADLPTERVTSEGYAFGRIGADVFGPFLVKSGRGEKKRYGLMCTCMTSRAVHIEILDSLRSDSLINAIRRVSARRGPIHYIVSDQGTGLTGAHGELKDALGGISQESLQQSALKLGIDWQFNPPTASHFGGLTERQIRTFRKVWRTMPAQRLDDETIQTLFCEIESIMNGRPLNYVTTKEGNIEPITPGHLLFLRGGMGAIPGNYAAADAFSRRRWRQVQYLADQFWVRWSREFLPVLQERQKWRSPSRCMRPGDICLLVNPNLPRGRWQMGRVLDALPSKDGLVRKVQVKTATSTLVRPVHKLILLSPAADLEW